MKKWLTIGLSILLIVLQYRLLGGNSSLLDVVRLRRIIEAEHTEIAKLTKRNQMLDAEVQLLKARPEALEDRARTELGMIKKGETFCLVIEPAR